MATISHIPNPISVSVKTAGYTIPANRYARAVVNVIGSATFTINAVTALAGAQNNVITTVGNVYRGNAALTRSSGSINGGQLYSGGGLITVSTETLTAVYGNETDQKPLVQEYFLPAGTVINGTGTWRATVEEYGG